MTITCDNGSIFDTDLNGVAFGEVSGSVTVTQAAEEGGWRFSEDSTLHLIESVNEIQFVTGVDVDDPWVSSYVETTGGWRAEVEPNTHDCESTGAVLKIYDADDELVESYVIIVFGDADGNAVIDGEDVMLIKDVVNRMGNVEWMNYNDTDEFPQSFASDIDHNYTVDD